MCQVYLASVAEPTYGMWPWISGMRLPTEVAMPPLQHSITPGYKTERTVTSAEDRCSCDTYMLPLTVFSRLHGTQFTFTPRLGKFHSALILLFLSFCPAQTAGDGISHHQKRQDAKWTSLYSGLNPQPGKIL